MEKRSPSLQELLNLARMLTAAEKGKAVEWGWDQLHNSIKIEGTDAVLSKELEGQLYNLLRHTFFAGALHSHRVASYMIMLPPPPGERTHPDDARRIDLFEHELEEWEQECRFEYTRQGTEGKKNGP